ncbi:hypothetical protein KC960_02075, partial [Candidatus Saccharibacteria bacterium]|nr:hypothetical protein [Candidatus Saccharibacteria bacterium]
MQAVNTTPAQAASATLNFQGRLLSSTGSLVPDGNYHIEFKLYNDTSSAGTPDQGACTYGGGTPDTECLWVETRSTGNLVTVQNGYFSVYLGDVTSLPTIDWSQDLYLGMNIGGSSGSPSWDGEMTPRFKLTSVPYAYTSQNVATKETNSASTNSDSVSITSGNALGATSNSGNISIDTGTATGTTGSILLGPSSTSSILFGNGTSNPDFTFQGSGTFTIASLDCTGNANGGALTANGSGVISCSDDDGGGGSGLFTDGGTFTYLTSTTDDLVVGASSVAGASLFVDVSAGSVTIGNGSLAGSLIISDGSSNTGTILVNATAGDYSFTIPTVTANDTFCLSALGNCAGVGGVGDIVNNGQNGTVRVGSNDSNSVILETSNTDRLTIDSAGAATFTSTVTGTTLNATTGVNTGAGAGTQRIDASGNLVNIGTITSGLINGQTISSSANFTGTITVQGASATLGVASTTTGSAIFRNAGGSGGITLTPANPGASSYTITLPAETGTVCTTATVCTGYAPSSGGSYIAKNTNDTSTASYAGYLLGLTNTNTGAAGVLSLSNAGTSGALSITSSTTGNGQSISLTNTSGSQTAGLAIDRNGAGGTTSSLIRLSQTAGTASNALTIAGTFTNIINATNFTVNNAGAITTSVGSGGSSLYNSSSGSGLVLSALNGTTTAQLRVTSNNNGWADSQTTSYFQVKNTSNNNLTFMGGGYGTDTQLNRLQFASLYTTITDLAFTSTPAPTALFELVSGNTTKVNLKVKAAASQTSDLLQLQDSSSNVNASFSSSGAQLTLGRIASTGSVVQGQLILSDGTTDNFSSTLQTATLGASRTITLPDETGTVCTTGSVCSGYQASSTAIVQVPTTTAQNTIQPTAASVVALTVNGSSNATGAVALSVAQTKAFAGISVTQSAAAVGLSITSSSTGNGQNISLTNTSGTQVAGVSIDRNGAGGTTTSLLSLSQTSGTATNGILLSGTIGTDITTSANRALTIDSNGT